MHPTTESVLREEEGREGKKKKKRETNEPLGYDTPGKMSEKLNYIKR